MRGRGKRGGGGEEGEGEKGEREEGGKEKKNTEYLDDGGFRLVCHFVLLMDTFGVYASVSVHHFSVNFSLSVRHLLFERHLAFTRHFVHVTAQQILPRDRCARVQRA